MKKLIFLFSNIFMVMFSAFAGAFERDHDAHEHGHATLMVAIEKEVLQIALKSPAMNIVGFEYQPSSHEDKEKVHKAEAQLKKVSELFGLPESAGCELEHTKIESSLLASAYDHHDHHDDELHSEFEAEYHFECESISTLNAFDVKLFKLFPGMEEVEAQIVGDRGQKLIELVKGKTQVAF